MLLLDAASQVFARKGYAGASVEEIAETAGFSIGALYGNFASKEALFLELLAQRGKDRLNEAAQALDRHGGDGHAVMTELGRMVVEAADKDVDFALLQAEFWLYAVRNPHVLDSMSIGLSETTADLERLVGYALERRGAAVEVSSEAVAVVVAALFNGLVRQRRIDPASVPETLFGQALVWLFAGLTASSTRAGGD